MIDTLLLTLKVGTILGAGIAIVTTGLILVGWKR